MPLFDPRDHTHLAMLKHVNADLYVNYVYDPTYVSHELPLRSSFIRRSSPAHVAVLCASPDRMGSTWTVTNVRAVESYGIGPIMYQIALWDLSSLSPDSMHSPAADAVWSGLRSTPGVVSRSIDGALTRGTLRQIDTGAMQINHEVFIDRLSAKRGVDFGVLEDEMLFAVLDKFAVIEMDKL